MYVIDYMLLKAQMLTVYEIQVENGRIIIDPHTFNIYGMPGPSLQPIESFSPTDGPDDKVFEGVPNVIYKATSRAFQEYRRVLEKCEMLGKDELPLSRKIPFNYSYSLVP